MAQPERSKAITQSRKLLRERDPEAIKNKNKARLCSICIDGSSATHRRPDGRIHFVIIKVSWDRSEGFLTVASILKILQTLQLNR